MFSINDLSHGFPVNKRLMLNVLYDTLDKLGFHLEKANSERGTLIVLSSGPESRRMRIACEGSNNVNQSTVRVFPDIMDDTGRQTAKLLMDEILATVKSSLKN
ncbi:MAG: hypothetical protein GXY12_10045 [Clostridiaceae bacterium]|nr:hypothetical protein [Clostridiaceae bacterium]